MSLDWTGQLQVCSSTKWFYDSVFTFFLTAGLAEEKSLSSEKQIPCSRPIQPSPTVSTNRTGIWVRREYVYFWIKKNLTTSWWLKSICNKNSQLVYFFLCPGHLIYIWYHLVTLYPWVHPFVHHHHNHDNNTNNNKCSFLLLIHCIIAERSRMLLNSATIDSFNYYFTN